MKLVFTIEVPKSAIFISKSQGAINVRESKINIIIIYY